MNKREFADFCYEIKDVMNSYLNKDAWEETGRWFSRGQGYINIEYSDDDIDWTKVNSNWETDCWSELNMAATAWGGSFEWMGSEISVGFNLNAISADSVALAM